MNSAHQVETLEISDADLDTVAGGLMPEVTLSLDDTTLSSADALSQLSAVQGEALGALGQTHQVGFNASL
ncbi:hypothetical protein [Streptomyces roseochromogenus]|uniref:Type A2 lantipeptide n=1 Tax=Streptomyces roseochromogenus subsp. oscitans DS 12.976 TaxID=1352936 RepID=V6K7N3_STRRC|nr:hypothetical protein [Streptomyces roseochromogenus]EST28058.1 hypothetical protein M878_23590 [Streptomyces roseochromogenus subsp. oscitans DS 12.976]